MIAMKISANTAPNSPLTAVRQWLINGAVAAGILDSGVVFGAEHTRDIVSYSVSQGTSTHTEDIVGNDMATFNFVFTARLPYGADVVQNLKSSALMSNLCEWIIQKQRSADYPTITGYDVTKMTVSNPMLVSVDANTALYQLQIQINAEALV